jgi:hypothetical protein
VIRDGRVLQVFLGLIKILMCFVLSTLLWLGIIRLLASFGPSILFFNGVLAALSANLLLALIFVRYSRFKGFFNRCLLAAAMAVASGSLQICFLVVFPVSFDRSVSIFLLAQIRRAENEVSPAFLEEQLVELYVHRRQAVARRLAEQLEVGNIEFGSNGGYSLSPRGRALLCMGSLLQAPFSFSNQDLINACD